MLVPLMRQRLLTALTGTPDVLNALLTPLGSNDPMWDYRPDPDRFTLRELIAHLVDFDSIFLDRLRRVRDEDKPKFSVANVDQLAKDHDYAHSDPKETRALFRERRSVLVEFLRNLNSAEWVRVGYIESATGGAVTLEGIAAFVFIHDGYHLQQTAEWTTPCRG